MKNVNAPPPIMIMIVTPDSCSIIIEKPIAKSINFELGNFFKNRASLLRRSNRLINRPCKDID